MLLRQALSDEVGRCEIYVKGTDVSYYYEGYVLYRTEDVGNVDA